MPAIVLVTPQIPPNTGNIARTCAATTTPLHLVGPLGFDLSDRALKRAGLDYWPQVNLTLHTNWEAFYTQQRQQGGRTIGFSTSGRCSYTELTYRPDDWLLFGSETAGLPKSVLATCDETAYIPMDRSAVRSLNLSVSAAIALYETLRQLQLFPPHSILDSAENLDPA
ncbi:tRNA (cytidine(34)-2'-O)-methyltransferase [Phormidium tenue]|uniref:Putative tRNA (cytidine(34)-2'-O)-methyltransferase n=1 Tax=Phormidium tenue NIES-30 TaxID=549789 RepID=A0A1U7J9X8_9CYAN|nr:tRNA (cytidine(34)-2'-O)-methyltransferase [Phormidium tenue]MBD2230690.1 tRNA (cytidine(34)-2'-O)-methyltransferase [Phormidium tenue FACHB-1052]OKH50553.1 tRNA (uridine(34)/cytosine(34)/5-carboxymethylaminomethyluridine(34)-2'-O)-methyltransferase TrmL [Phormidium tenue NIES-30]